jgi:hypothetical protein
MPRVLVDITPVQTAADVKGYLSISDKPPSGNIYRESLAGNGRITFSPESEFAP